MDPISSDMFRMLMWLQNKLAGICQTVSPSVAGLLGTFARISELESHFGISRHRVESR